MYELSEHSRFLNLGYCEKGQKRIKPIEAQKQLIRLVADAGDFQKDILILDVGCGLGGPALLISEERDCSVIGIDPGTYQIEKTNLWLRNQTSPYRIKFHYGDAVNLPFADNSFDRVYSVESAFHFQDKAQFLKEAARTLKKNGTLVIADILRSTDKKDSWLSRKLGKALSAEKFFNITLYKNNALQAGLEFVHNYDISENVARTFHMWARSHFNKFFKLLKTYRFMTLFKIGIALFLAPALSSFTHFRYHILVFRNN